MAKLLFFFIAIVFHATFSVAQTPFTLETAYAKLLKNYPNISIYRADSLNVIAHCDVEFCRIGERVLKCDIFLPKNTIEQLLPLAIIVHGGGWQSGDKSMDNEIAKALANNGIAAICVDYRKSGEALFPAAVHDVRTAIRWARMNAEKYHFNTDKFTLIGSSAGGQIASLIGSINGDYTDFDNDIYAEYSSHVASVIDIDGVLAFIHPDSSEGADKPGKPSSATLWFGCAVSENPALWNEASAVNHVNENSANFLIIKGGQKRFTAGCQELADSLKIYGRDVEITSVDDAPHTFWLFNPWAQTTVDLIVAWMSKH